MVRKVKEENSLLYKFPDIAKQWHPNKNGTLLPSDMAAGSHKIAWWLCPKCDEDYDLSIGGRTSNKTTYCPYCDGKRVGKKNNLLAKFPDIAKQWHPNKNGKLQPEDVYFGSTIIAWWFCERGHEYTAQIGSKARNNTKCTKCINQSSKPEIRILAEFKYLFSNVVHQHIVNRYKLDVFIPKYNIAIEYDGSYYHRHSEERDRKKNKIIKSKNINLIRVRHYPLKKISLRDIVVKNDNLRKDDLNYILKNIFSLLDTKDKIKINEYILDKKFKANYLYKKYLSYFPAPIKENSLLFSHPKLCKEWDYENNLPLKPNLFTYGSNEKVWWLCSKCDESYKSTIQGRGSRGDGCPYCASKKLGKYNNLLAKFPDIAKEWHPTKNGTLLPSEVIAGSHKKVWWLCPKCDEDYDLATGLRTDKSQKQSCPYCAGKKVGKYNNLLAKFPDIAKEWHPTKNGTLLPSEVIAGSHKKVWWLCPKCDEDYDLATGLRTYKSQKQSCPYCAGKRVGKYNNLLAKFPDIAKEWHPTKNGDLKAEGVLSRSDIKVWWKCNKCELDYYEKIESKTKKYPVLCPHCKESKLIKKRLLKLIIKKLRKKGLSFSQVANKLNDDGYKQNNGKPYKANTVHSFLNTKI